MRPAALKWLKVLAAMDEADEDAEIVCEGGGTWFGMQRLQRETLRSLLLSAAVSLTTEAGGFERYRINGTGRAIAANPALDAQVRAALFASQPFTITDGAMVYLERGER